MPSLYIKYIKKNILFKKKYFDRINFSTHYNRMNSIAQPF